MNPKFSMDSPTYTHFKSATNTAKSSVEMRAAMMLDSTVLSKLSEAIDEQLAARIKDTRCSDYHPGSLNVTATGTMQRHKGTFFVQIKYDVSGRSRQPPYYACQSSALTTLMEKAGTGEWCDASARSLDRPFHPTARTWRGEFVTSNELPKSSLTSGLISSVDEIICEFRAKVPTDVPEDIFTALSNCVGRPSGPTHWEIVGGVCSSWHDPSSVYFATVISALKTVEKKEATSWAITFRTWGKQTWNSTEFLVKDYEHTLRRNREESPQLDE